MRWKLSGLRMVVLNGACSSSRSRRAWTAWPADSPSRLHLGFGGFNSSSNKFNSMDISGMTKLQTLGHQTETWKCLKISQHAVAKCLSPSSLSMQHGCPAKECTVGKPTVAMCGKCSGPYIISPRDAQPCSFAPSGLRATAIHTPQPP